MRRDIERREKSGRGRERRERTFLLKSPPSVRTNERQGKISSGRGEDVQERKGQTKSSSNVLPHSRDPIEHEPAKQSQLSRRDEDQSSEGEREVEQTSQMRHPCSPPEPGCSTAKSKKRRVQSHVLGEGGEKREREETNLELLFRQNPLQLQNPSFPDLMSVRTMNDHCKKQRRCEWWGERRGGVKKKRNNGLESASENDDERREREVSFVASRGLWAG